MNALLEARGVTKGYGGSLVVDHIDLTAEAGRITVIVGSNGAGKTTLFDCLSGVVEPDEGVVRHSGVDVTGWSCDALARTGMVRTFQHLSVFPTLTVADNLRVAAENRRRRGIVGGLIGLGGRSERAATEVVRATLVELGLTPLADVPAGVLPSGTLRLVEMARALCASPDTLLLDEPTSGLDDVETEQFHRLLHRVAGRGIALVMVEHDLGLVQQAADVVYVMDAGRVIARGAPDAVLERVDVRSLLGGETM